MNFAYVAVVRFIDGSLCLALFLLASGCSSDSDGRARSDAGGAGGGPAAGGAVAGASGGGTETGGASAGGTAAGGTETGGASAGGTAAGGAVGGGTSTGGSGAGGAAGAGGASTGGSGAGGAAPGSGGSAAGGAAGSGGAIEGTGGAPTCPAGLIWCPGCTPGFGTCQADSCFGITCPDCASQTTLDDCERLDDCHPVFVDPGTCGCPAAGCCARFSRCAAGAQANCTGEAQCDVVTPHCEGDYRVAYAGGCFEGCVRSADCAP